MQGLIARGLLQISELGVPTLLGEDEGSGSKGWLTSPWRDTHFLSSLLCVCFTVPHLSVTSFPL
jgi:hypothetical protein